METVNLFDILLMNVFVCTMNLLIWTMYAYIDMVYTFSNRLCVQNEQF